MIPPIAIPNAPHEQRNGEVATKPDEIAHLEIAKVDMVERAHAP
jgi:hypothetical protein